MKKIIVVLLLLISLVACGNNQETSYIDINSFDVDMSDYVDMNSTNHHFKGITPKEFLRIIEEDGSGIFYIGYTNCGSCQNNVALFEEAAENTDSTIYYINVYPSDESYDFFDTYDALVEALDSILRHEDGVATIYTPHLIALKNGEFAASLIGGDHTLEEIQALMEEI